RAVQHAREMGLAGTLMNTLALTSLTYVFSGDWTTATGQLDELSGLAEEKGSSYWKAFALCLEGWLLALTGKTPEAVEMLTSGITARRSTGATLFAPLQLSCLATAYAQLGQFADARRSIGVRPRVRVRSTAPGARLESAAPAMSPPPTVVETGIMSRLA